MNLHLLASHLHPTAKAAVRYFGKEHGARNFKGEYIIASDLSLKPTLSASLDNGCILCVEVSERVYSNSLDTFVVECTSKSFPAKLYVVVPSLKGDPDLAANLRKAKERGVGVVEIPDESTPPFTACEAVSLSLFGLRRVDTKEFPKNKRESIHQAEATFLNGNPVKGCQSLYEELEVLTRAFAKRSLAEGWWRSVHVGEAKPKENLDVGPWARVLAELGRFLDMTACRKKCPLMNEGLIGSARGVTDPRNLTSHRPSNLKKIIERDKRLRTWFESTHDLLKAWYEATKPLKL